MIYSDDEIGQLSKKFDIMAEAIDNRVLELTNIARQREDFVANFTHEVKTPLTSIIGYADMLRSKDMDKENMLIATNYIFDEGKRLENMSSKLFDILLLGREAVNKKSIYAKDLIDDIEMSVVPMLKIYDIALETNIDNQILLIDKDLIKTVFINIIDNARKASHNNSIIFINGYKKENKYIYEIIDEGIGFPKEEISKVTEAFYMVDKSRSRSEGGAGLGLSLALTIIDLHSGSLDIKSEQKKGLRYL